MKRFAQFLLWAAALLLAVWLIDLSPGSEEPADTAALALPEDAPDVYITGLELTRYNAEGQPILQTAAESMSVYNAESESRLTEPTIYRLAQNIPTWKITSEQASLFGNDNIEFRRDVVVAQQNVNDPLIVTSEQMRYAQQQQWIETDQPVEVVQGNQRVTAVGMTVNLDTIEPVIQLLSDVDFYYDPS